MKDRLNKCKLAFYSVQNKARFFGVLNPRVRLQLVQSLAVTHLLFGAVVFGCLTCTDIMLFQKRSAAHADWYELEVFYRRMIRWAMKCHRNIRTSVLYAVSGCATIQALVLKKCVRYCDKLSAEVQPRFVNLVYQSIVE